MKFKCPYCRKECDYMELQHESDIKALIAMLPVFGKNAGLVMAYAELFGISPMRVKMKKLLVIMNEMKMLLQTEEFSYQKKRYRISPTGIAEALNVVVHRHFEDHLDSHNYLKKIMIGIAEKEEKDAGRQADKALYKREAQAMAGHRDDTGRGHDAEARRDRIVSPEVEETITEEQRQANLKRINSIIKGIG